MIAYIKRLIAKPTIQDLWNAYYSAKVKKDYAKMRTIGNKITILKKKRTVTIISGTVSGNEVISG